MSEKYTPYIPFIFNEYYLTDTPINDALLKAVKKGVPTKSFTFKEYFGFTEFEKELTQFRRHIDGITIVIGDLNLVYETRFEELLQKAINYGIRRYVIVYDNRNSCSNDDIIDDGFAQDEISHIFSRHSLVKVEFKYVRCSVDCRHWESADEIRPFVEEINRTIVEPAMKNNDFCLPIKQVLSVKGMGIIAVGTVLNGSLKVGEHVVIIGKGKRILASVKGFELRRNIVDWVTVGDDAGVILQGVNSEDIDAGMIVISL